MKFVIWCNDNQGFITAVFSLLSLLISSIAIVISITTAKLPYKRALRVSNGSYFSIGDDMQNMQGVYVNVLNVGNIPINISEVGLLCGEMQCININTISEARGVLKQMETVEQSFPIEDLQESFRGKKGRVYAFAKDAEGHIYKKFMCGTKTFENKGTLR